MRLIKKIYFYFKWFIPNHREEYPWVYEAVRWPFAYGLVSMPFLWLLSLLPFPGEVETYCVAGVFLGFFLAAGSALFLIYHFMEQLIWDRYHSLVRLPRLHKVDKTRFYASSEKYRVPLPAPRDIPLHRIQIGESYRYFISPAAIDAMAASLKLAGLVVPIKIRPLTTEEKRSDPDHDYRLIGGQIRIRAAIQLDWETIKAYVLDLDPNEGKFEEIADNRFPDKPWITEYEEIWEFLKTLPMLTLDQYAQLNRRNPVKLRAMLEVLDLLTPKARKLILQRLQWNQDEFFEMHGYALEKNEALLLHPLFGMCHDLALNRGLVERAVLKIFKWEMEREEIQELVQWTKDGYYPDDFGEAGDRFDSWKPHDKPEAVWEKPAFSPNPAGEKTGTGQERPPEGKTEKVAIDSLRSSPYNEAVIQEGGLKSYAKFVHHCLRLKGLGTSRENNYEWGVKSVMGWFDPSHPEWFPLFDPGPGRIEEPLYVFYITKVGDRPLRWICAAEVEDVLRGCHLFGEPVWIKDVAECIQKGILDRMDHPQGVWAGGVCGVVGVIGMKSE